MPNPNNSTRQSQRPQVPEGFPLWPHPSGRWCKKVRGRAWYFGKISDGWQAALDKWLAVKDDLLAGRTPRLHGDGLTLAELCNKFLSTKMLQLNSGEIVPRTFADYKTVCDRLVAVFGKNRLVADLAADDFERLRGEMAKSRGLVALGNEITRTRTVFKYGYDQGLLDRPIRYGTAFRRPSKKALRILRGKNGERMFTPEQILRLLEVADQPLRTMILLGINCGYGNADVGNLRLQHLDLQGGWANYSRPKTGVPRRCPLWPETVAALRDWLPQRPKPKDPKHADLVFMTKYGQPWAKETSDSPVTKEFRKALNRLQINRKGLGFYALRHTFQTVGEEAGEVATRHIMGHVDPSMSAVYRERISDERLKAVTEHVRSWLFGDERGQQ